MLYGINSIPTRNNVIWSGDTFSQIFGNLQSNEKIFNVAFNCQFLLQLLFMELRETRLTSFTNNFIRNRNPKTFQSSVKNIHRIFQKTKNDQMERFDFISYPECLSKGLKLL